MHQTHLADLERTAYRTLVDDGLLDLGMGIFFLSFWMSSYVPIPGLPALVFLLLVVVWRWLRSTIIEARVGTVRLSSERIARIRRGKSRMTAFTAVPLLLLGLWALVEGGVPPVLLGKGELLVAIIFGSALIMGGWMLEIKRLWIYALALVVTGTWVTLLGEPFDEFNWTVSGAVALIIGTGVFLRFLRRYPKMPATNQTPPTSLTENSNV